jgi:two-component system, response regulator YesN
MKMLKILLVEDNHQFREIFKQELSESFPSILIEEASNGKEATEKADSFRPQLIFMDIRLSDESGLQLTKNIKLKFPEITVAMLTSHDLPEYRQAAGERGASHFFVKGSSVWSEIRAFVESLLPHAA